jgi:hypothetical protein
MPHPSQHTAGASLVSCPKAGLMSEVVQNVDLQAHVGVVELTDRSLSLVLRLGISISNKFQECYFLKAVLPTNLGWFYHNTKTQNAAFNIYLRSFNLTALIINIE